MKLAFISVGGQPLFYFVELGPYLRERGIECEFFSRNIKVRSILKRSGITCHPVTRAVEKIPLADAFVNRVVTPVLEQRYPDPGVLRNNIAELYAQLSVFLERCAIDAIFLWNGSGLVARVATEIAADRGVRTLFGENGYLPHTMQIDTEGVNQLASISRRVEHEYRNVDVDPAVQAELNRNIEILHQGRAWGRRRSTVVSAGIWATIRYEWQRFSWRRALRHGAMNRRIVDCPEVLPDKYILVPLQVEADSQLILHSPLLGSDMRRFVAECFNAVRGAAPEYRLLVKLHPQALRRTDYDDLAREYPDVLFVKSGAMSRLILNSAAVITINSTVGFEALTYYRPVIMLGENFYNVAGVVDHVDTLGQLPEVLSAALTTEVDRQLVDQLLYYLYASYFVHGSLKDFSESSYHAVAARIADLLSRKDEYEN